MGGTGVVPEKRGTGLTQKMYRFILPHLIEIGVDRIILEVITKNVQAIKSYRKSGFKTKRELVCYAGSAIISKINRHIEIKNLQSYSWSLMEGFWDFSPTWQNSNSVLNALKNSNYSLGAFIKKRLVGYIIYNPTNKRIQQLAIHKDFRKIGIASTLVAGLMEKYENSFAAINVDKKSTEVNEFFRKLSLESTLEQLEMELLLHKNKG